MHAGKRGGCISADYKVAVVADGYFDRNQTCHAVSLVDMSAKYADIVSAQEVLDWMKAN